MFKGKIKTTGRRRGQKQLDVTDTGSIKQRITSAIRTDSQKSLKIHLKKCFKNKDLQGDLTSPFLFGIVYM